MSKDRRPDEQPEITFLLLGELAVRHHGEPVPIGHARQRSVLAVLLVEADRAVPVDSLLDRVWGERPPRRARSALRTYLSHLRHALVPTGVTITRRDTGYLLSAEPDRIDLQRFRQLLALAREADEPERALVLVDQALALWRGDPLAELDTAWAHAVRERLRQERFAAVTDRADWLLRCGGHRGLLPELTARATAHPLDERVAGQLMLALYRDGRQADALEHYERTRVRLAEELGADPAAPLRELHRRILVSDPTLEGKPARVAAPPVPRQLPPAPSYFTGRAPELAALTASFDGAGPGRTVVISAIAGAGGVGKTWLALTWAHRHADLFPDGQLFVDLQGFSPSATPMDPFTAVRGFLDALGVNPGSVPPDPHAQAALYRSLMADKRMLVVVDNARGADQVVPLLPGSPTCTVIVTSRNRLTELLNRHSAHAVPVDVLADTEARQVLVDRLGAGRVAAEPGAVRELLDWCGGFPLALGIVAGRASAYPGFPLATLAAELRDTATRLDALDDDNPAASLPAVLSWSHDALSPEHARAFALLGQAPGHDLGLHAAADLLDRTTSTTRAVLRALEDVHLLQQHTPGRWRMHDLIKLYAADRAGHDTTEAERSATSRRLVDFYQRTAAVAEGLLYPAEAPKTSSPAPTATGPVLTTPAEAKAWLDVERDNLVSCTAHAADRGLVAHAIDLAGLLCRHLDVTGLTPTALAVAEDALRAARACGDRRSEARAMLSIGNSYNRLGRFPVAAEHLRHTLDVAREAGDRFAEARALGLLGWALAQLGQHEEALGHLRLSVAIARGIGDPTVAGSALNNMGVIYQQQGRYDELLGLLHEALAEVREVGNRVVEGRVLGNIGAVHVERGALDAALRHLRQALMIHREVGNRTGEGIALLNIAGVHHGQGDFPTAYRECLTALDILRDTGDRAAMMSALNGAGESANGMGRADEAIGHHREALAMAAEDGNVVAQAHAHAGLGNAHHTSGDLTAAVRHWRLAQAAFAGLDAPEAKQLTEKLAEHVQDDALTS